METLDPAYVQAQLSSPPFVTVEGASNIRSLGDYPSESAPGCCTRSNFIFRSGEISGITPTGEAQLKDLGIKKVFDLRSDVEIMKFGLPPPELGSEVEIERIPVFKDEDYSPEMLTLRSKLFKSGKVESLMEIYTDILDGGGPAFTAIFKHIRDRPADGFLFHCSAGKDRSGVLAALILKIAGVDDDRIAKDYQLTRIGRDPERAAIIEKLSKVPDFANDREGLLNMLDCRHESMLRFLQLLETRHGGAECYLQSHLGFSAVEIATIRKNMLADAEPQPSILLNPLGD